MHTIGINDYLLQKIIFGKLNNTVTMAKKQKVKSIFNYAGGKGLSGICLIEQNEI